MKYLFYYDTLVCQESIELFELPIIAGATWDFTNNWDCKGNDIVSDPVPVWGNEGSIESRKGCANKCLKLSNCVAFNFPQAPRLSGNCHMKKSTEKSCQKSTNTGRDWNSGVADSEWQYYTLIDKTTSCSGISVSKCRTLIMFNTQ